MYIYSGEIKKVAFFYSELPVSSAWAVSQRQNCVPQQIVIPALEGRHDPVIRILA
jgi:hypothetical protein